MRTGRLNLAVRRSFIMEGVHFAGMVKGYIGMLLIGMGDGLVLLIAEKLHTLVQGNLEEQELVRNLAVSN